MTDKYIDNQCRPRYDVTITVTDKYIDNQCRPRCDVTITVTDTSVDLDVMTQSL